VIAKDSSGLGPSPRELCRERDLRLDDGWRARVGASLRSFRVIR
jgi:hypothetical protein